MKDLSAKLLALQAHTLLLKKHATLATAESCTGGLLAKLLTDLPGSSGYFMAGIVSYGNQAKIKLLGVPAKTLSLHGAVSQETALAMARNVKRLSLTDVGIGITGIAGPGGGTQEKPVGTVFIAAASRRKTLCAKFRFKGSRAKIRTQAAAQALALLLTLL